MFWKKNKVKDEDKLATIEFANRTSMKKFVCIEPVCFIIELEEHTEYQIVTREKDFRMEFDKDDTVIFYLQYSFGLKVNKRPTSTQITNPNSWILEMDLSHLD